jgi:hypothetical protein
VLILRGLYLGDVAGLWQVRDAAVYRKKYTVYKYYAQAKNAEGCSTFSVAQINFKIGKPILLAHHRHIGHIQVRRVQ